MGARERARAKRNARAPDLVALARALRGLHFPDRARNDHEHLDLVDVAAGTKPLACAYAYDLADARALARELARRTRKAGLRHAVQLLPDDRAALLRAGRAPAFVVRGIAATALELAVVLTWRRTDAAPPPLEKADLGRLLGYPACCARSDLRARRELLVAEARGLVRSLGARTAADVTRAIQAETRYAFTEPELSAKTEARLARFPFAGFVPCPRCVRRGADGPAGRVNAWRRKLARAARMI